MLGNPDLGLDVQVGRLRVSCRVNRFVFPSVHIGLTLFDLYRPKTSHSTSVVSPACTCTTGASFPSTIVIEMPVQSERTLPRKTYTPPALSSNSKPMAASDQIASYVRSPLFRRPLPQHPAPPTPEEPVLSGVEGSFTPAFQVLPRFLGLRRR